MIWQDIVIMIASVTFLVSLIPMAKNGPYPPLLTSIPTFLGLASISICFFTLGLILSTILTTLTSLIWMYMAYQEAEIG